MKEDSFDALAKRWRSGLVARTQISEFSGGLLTPKYLANLDSQGLGPPRVRSGRRVAYDVEQLVVWMRDRSI